MITSNIDPKEFQEAFEVDEQTLAEWKQEYTQTLQSGETEVPEQEWLEAKEINEKINRMDNTAMFSQIEIGKLIYDFDIKKKWSSLGYSSLDNWLTESTITGRSSGHRYKNLYELEDDYQLDRNELFEAKRTNLYKLADANKRQKKADNPIAPEMIDSLVNAAQELAEKEFTQHINELVFGKLPEDDPFEVHQLAGKKFKLVPVDDASVSADLSQDQRFELVGSRSMKVFYKYEEGSHFLEIKSNI